MLERLPLELSRKILELAVDDLEPESSQSFLFGECMYEGSILYFLD